MSTGASPRAVRPMPHGHRKERSGNRSEYRAIASAPARGQRTARLRDSRVRETLRRAHSGAGEGHA